MSMFSWFTNLFKKKPAPAPASIPPPVVKPPTFVDNFATLDTSKWGVSTWQAPSNTAVNVGSFAATNVSIVNGMLCLKLSQTVTNGKATSVGGEITSVQKFGYGTYEFVAKASSNSSNPTASGSSVSGSITGMFGFINNSQTEIDVEIEGCAARSANVELTTWVGDTNPNEATVVTPPVAPHAGFHKYKYVWTPTDITYYIDDVQVSKHTKVIPSTPAFFLFNHYGTNDPDWGGQATPGVDRFMFVKSFAFTAA